MENNAKIMAADVVRKYKQLESTRLAALHDGDRLAYNKARAQQDILADLLDKWDVSIEDAGIDYTRLAPDMPSFPRTRGGDPYCQCEETASFYFSPHTRG